MNFEWLNGSGPSEPVPGPPPSDPSVLYTEVEWAMAVSPRPPDLAITKKVTPTTPLLPGEWLTYTLVYTNLASHWAEGVIITDPLPPELVNDVFTYTTTFGRPITDSGRYIWEVGRLGYLEGGVITVAAQIDPAITDSQRIFLNEVEIGADTAERDAGNNEASTETTAHTADLWVTKDGPTQVTGGEMLTYTLSFGNDGPANAAGVVLTDLFPEDTTFDSHNSSVPSAAIPGGRIWTVGPLNAGLSATFVLTLNMPVTMPVSTLLTNTFIISTEDTPESATANNQVLAQTLVVGYCYLPVIYRDYEP
jgi:uncharacterized repeat protein (TIGR01451 family)